MCDDHYEGGNDWTDVYRGTGIESAGNGRYDNLVLNVMASV